MKTLPRPLGTAAAAAALLLLLAAGPPAVHAAVTATKNGGGVWSEDGTWTQGIPSGSDFATISAGDAVSIATPGAGAYVLYNNGIIDLQADASPSLLAGSLGVGLQLNVGYVHAGQILLSGGARLNSVDSRIGALAGADGFIKIDGALNRNGDRARWTNSGELVVGASGFGLSEGRVILIDQASIDAQNVSIGSGESRGYAEVNNATWSASNLFRVGSGGVLGVLSISNGGQVNSRTGVIGYGSGSTGGLVDTLGQASVDNARWINSGDFVVGAYAKGELTLSAGALLSNQYGTVGQATSAHGSVRVNDAVWRNTALLTIASEGIGTLQIEQGGRVESPSAIIGRFGAAKGSVSVDGASWINLGDLVVGHGVTGLPGSHAEGSLTVIHGGRVENRDAIVAQAGGSSGTVEVHGLGTGGAAATWASSGDLFIGRSGSGRLSVGEGGVVSSRQTYLGYDAADGGNGRLELAGSGPRRGVLETGQLSSGTGAGPQGGTLVFDGGLLRASLDQPQLLRNFGSVTVDAGGAFIDSQAHSVGIDAGFNGSGGLNKLGTGSLDLRGVSTLGSLSKVQAGRLLVNGSLYGDVEVGAGGLLGGAGQIEGLVTVLPGGALSPGNSPGTLRTGSLALHAGSTLLIEIGVLSDRLVVDGDLGLSGTIDFFGDASSFTAGALPSFLTYSGLLLDQSAIIGRLPEGVDRQAFVLDFSTPGMVGLAAAVPEPGAWLLMSIGLAGLGLRRRWAASAG